MIDCTVLVLGAGGLGCEILKNLAMLQVRNIHVVDLDTIELTNLNRQFLFTEYDIGKPKAEVAAKYINNWNEVRQMENKGYPEVIVTPYVRDLTLFPVEFFKQYQFVISGLDAIEPRRYVNKVLVQITRETHFEVCIPFIDGGTEGLKGHIKTIIPGITACWECSLDTLPLQQHSVPMCTVANNPRVLEHVIEYVATVECPDSELDNPEEAALVLERCFTRARKFDIDHRKLNMSYMLGVIKRIVPSVSTTNTIVAAACCNEVVKIYFDMVADYDNITNFIMINGADGFFMHKFKYERKPNCLVCSGL
ncbi:hypothetical protein HG535_0A02280 [Zygotorulaspora mrakii]|uniref:NEDD8-activating enzyme E1 catalytic subunit n=1 Tax=Zygotorulaspora mrakii TaxID=42260 RepID=A0A7H9AVB7_ZYGMR|nr:uncharacterized protein HG535_0A02280 [Zygotorulaspora mrakii]QLG70290.1 hypothetical protein HG535_0A02280 [Zygotorulaspora mrakii]